MSNRKNIIDDRLQLDVSTNQLLFLQNGNEQKVKLEPITVKVIKVLLDNQNQVVSRLQLIDEVWDGNLGVGKKALTRNIYKIRKVFAQHDMENLIETISKHGYRLNSLKGTSKIIDRRKKRIWLLVGVVLVILVVKITFPDFFHKLLHRLVH